MRLVELGRRGGLAEPPADAERVRPGDGCGEAREEVEAAHQQSRVTDGGQGGGGRVVEVEGGGATPGDRDQGVVTCNMSQIDCQAQAQVQITTIPFLEKEQDKVF